MATQGALSLLDEKLLDLAANGKSAQEIGKTTGMSPERALLRVREILASRDVWDDVEREKLLLHDLYTLKAKLGDNLENIITNPQQLDQYRKTLELLSATLEKRSRANNTDLEKVTMAQGRLLIRLIEAGYSAARKMLEAEYPEVDVKVIDSAFSIGMDDARVEIEAESAQ